MFVLAGKHVNTATCAAYVARQDGARDIHVDEVHLLQAPDDPASSERHYDGHFMPLIATRIRAVAE